MNEAQLTAQLLSTNEIFFTGISVGFTVYSAYIIGLYWFLQRANIGIKLIAFGLLTLSTVLIGIGGFGVIRHAQGATLALIELNTETPLTLLGQMAISEVAGTVANWLSLGLIGLLSLIYLGAFYLTFCFKWREEINP